MTFYTFPAEEVYRDNIRALEDQYVDLQLVVAYQSQAKAQIQLSSEPLPEFLAAIKQLAHKTLVGLPVDFIQREAIHAFIDTVRDQELKQHLLMGSDRSLSEAFSQTLQLDAAKAGAGPPSRLQDVTRVPMGMHMATTS